MCTVILLLDNNYRGGEMDSNWGSRICPTKLTLPLTSMCKQHSNNNVKLEADGLTQYLPFEAKVSYAEYPIHMGKITGPGGELQL